MKPRSITPERIERALDSLDALANVMVRSDPEGCVGLPLYQNLEQELAAFCAEEDAMSLVRKRARK